MRKGKVLLVMVAVLAMAGAAGAQILVNGGFEDPAVTDAKKWDIYDSGTPNLGWNVEWYQGSTIFNSRTRPMPAHLELHRGVNGWVPDEGFQYAELDTDWDGPNGNLLNEPASVQIWQAFDTCVGGTYRLTYAWSPRPSHADNKMQVLINGAPVATHSGSGGSTTVWKTETLEFTASSASTRLDFIETGTPQSFGMFLDDVVVEELECPCIVEDTVVDLCAGQTNNWGTVTVNNDDQYIYVDFNVTEPGWYLNEAHVAIGTNLTNDVEFPQTTKGNPIPGLYPYGCQPDPMQTSCRVMISLGDWCDGEQLFIAAHAALVMPVGDGCQSEGSTYWATTVENFDQGTLKNGLAVSDTDRTDPTAVFALDGSFYSLGFDLINDDGFADGYLTVGFGYPVYDGPLSDIIVREETIGRSTYPEELARVFGVQDGTDYFSGVVSNKSDTDGFDFVELNLPAGTNTVEFVKLLDATNPDLFNSRPTADGYDVDAIGACYVVMDDETGWGNGCDTDSRFTEKGNWGTYFPYVVNRCAPCLVD